jgi:positive regulator of sigma E activity
VFAIVLGCLSWLRILVDPAIFNTEGDLLALAVYLLLTPLSLLLAIIATILGWRVVTLAYRQSRWSERWTILLAFLGMTLGVLALFQERILLWLFY